MTQLEQAQIKERVAYEIWRASENLTERYEREYREAAAAANAALEATAERMGV